MSLKDLGHGLRQVAPVVMLAGALGATLVARRSAPGDPGRANVDPTLVQASNVYLKAVLAGDPSAIAALYCEDGVEMPQGHPPIEGRAAIEQNARQRFNSPVRVTSFAFDHRESTIVGDLAYDVGAYTQRLSLGQGGSIDETGKYVVLLRRQGSDWKIAYLIYNSDRQPAASASAAR